jgi:hypothetical protein
MTVNKEAIQKLSYEIWEREGRPFGHDLEHWLQAEAELAAEQARMEKAATATRPRTRQSQSPKRKLPRKAPGKGR